MEMWVEDGLLQKSDVEGWSFPATVVDYDAIIRLKHGLLDRIWSYSSSTCQELRDAFEEFRQAQAHWLEDYALFRALKERHNGFYY